MYSIVLLFATIWYNISASSTLPELYYLLLLLALVYLLRMMLKLPCPGLDCARQDDILDRHSFDFSFPERNEQIKDQFLGFREGLVSSHPGNWMMTCATAETIEDIRSMEVRDDDIWLVTYPKTGTTWMQELIWQVVNNLDLEQGKVFINGRFPFLEFDTATDIKWVFRNDELAAGKMMSGLLGYKNNIEKLADWPRNKRRFIKTHLPLDLLPVNLTQKAKVIYVSRTPHDAMVSYFHHSRDFASFDFIGNISTFATMFMNNQVMYGPYFPHVEGAWNSKDKLLFVWYEEMKRDLATVVRRVEEFLGVSLDADKLDDLLNHLHIDCFRLNPAVNLEKVKMLGGLFKQNGAFIRKGKCGGWVEEMSEVDQAQVDKFTSWVTTNTQLTGIIFPPCPTNSTK